MGKWIVDGPRARERHICNKPSTFMRRERRRWQCDCGRKYEITRALDGFKYWVSVCTLCDWHSEYPGCIKTPSGSSHSYLGGVGTSLVAKTL
jgi:hypothetical protein